jgi:hypothetical protein
MAFERGDTGEAAALWNASIEAAENSQTEKLAGK